MNLFDRLLALAFGEHSGRIIDEDGSVRNLCNAVDPLGGFSTYTELQHAIHSGKAYSVSLLSTVAGGATKYFLLKTGSKDIHLMEALFDFSDGNLEVRLYEGSTVTTDGTARSLMNLRRVTPMNTPVASIFENPTGVVVGTQLAVAPVYGTKNSPASGALAGGRVLSPNTNHIIEVKNLNGATEVSFAMTLLVHEHLVL